MTSFQDKDNQLILKTWAEFFFINEGYNAIKVRNSWNFSILTLESYGV